MKKLIMIAAIFLLGIGGLSAQTWDVTVSWDLSTSDCSNYNPNDYEIAVFITIYDDANNVYVCNNVSHIVSLTSSSTTFSAAEAGVQYHCEDDLDDTPNLNVYATVRVIDKTHTEQFCVAKATLGDKSCSYFVYGTTIYPTFN